jgi:hypothetical protein
MMHAVPMANLSSIALTEMDSAFSLMFCFLFTFIVPLRFTSSKYRKRKEERKKGRKKERKRREKIERRKGKHTSCELIHKQVENNIERRREIRTSALKLVLEILLVYRHYSRK